MSNTEPKNGNRKSLLVIGGGIAGVTAAIEAAETGLEVVLIEKSAYLGGQVARLHHYFPKLCPPACGLEINFKRLRGNPRVTVLTLAELEKLEGAPGNYQATVKITPRFVTSACTSCGDCTAACPAELADPFEFGLAKTKAVHTRKLSAYPATYVVERSACPQGCDACVKACKYAAIDLAQAAQSKTLQVSSVLVATGWKPYDATKLDNLGFGKHANVVTNLMFERLASLDGPNGGKVLRPSDRKEPKSVAFVQCAGSRDHNHLPYCSTVCCSASLKQASYVRSLYPEAKVTIFYIDLRTSGQLQEFATKVCADTGIELVKGKVGKIEEDPPTKNLQLTVEDVLNGKKTTQSFDMAVLATGMVPQTGGLPADCKLDEYGFVANGMAGIYAAGCAKRPSEVAGSVRSATGAALKALQIAGSPTDLASVGTAMGAAHNG
jgi:quinone-modifying oxidoreductase subunit QmoA